MRKEADLMFTVPFRIPCWRLGEHEPLIIYFFSRLPHAGTGRVHRPSVEVIGDVDHLGCYNWSLSRNGSRLEPFKWRGSCDKFWKKLVNGAGIVYGDFCVRHRKYPP